MIAEGDALKGLVAVLGSGGLCTIIVAFLNFWSEARKGRRGEPEAVADGVSKPAITAADVELLANSISDLAGAAIQMAALMKASAESAKHEREVAEEAEMRMLRDAFGEQRRRERDNPSRR